MAQETVKKIIEKAIADEAFRQQLFDNPQEALKPYAADLTAAEKQTLSNLNADNFDQFSGGLDDRSTKGSWTPGI